MFDWFRKRKKEDARLTAWRASWTAAIEQDSSITVDWLRRALDEVGGEAADVEVELEMLDALDALRTVQHAVTSDGLPVVDTHHRVVGGDRCHFTAPASAPGEAGQTAGRVLFTGGRAIFVGGGRSTAIAWHAVHEVLRSERDLLLARADATPGAHYQFNTFADAVVAAFLARQLKGVRKPRL